jgi:uroporphyrinogen decarboxylase
LRGARPDVSLAGMTHRERCRETLLFGRPDRVPLQPGSGRRSTREAWRGQGLAGSIEAEQIAEHAYRQAGGTLPWPAGGESFPVDERMIPRFEEKVLERRGDTQIVQDWKGNVCEISSRYTTEYLRDAIDFVTRRWVRCPVESRADWREMKKRYDADDPSRLPADAAARAKRLQGRSHWVALRFSGPFWQMREWLGFERLCMLFYDDPLLVEEMVETWTEYIALLVRRTLSVFVPDEIGLSEDMAYKSFSMISPAMARRFLFPAWRKWGDIVRGAGVGVYSMDSDGFVGELIPLWIEAGINCCDPMEVAAGNDLPALRRRFGRSTAFKGGVDKRAMARGGQTMEGEIARLEPVIRDGGYIPSCDHGVPPDVSWPDFVRYTGLLARATGWL